MAGTLSFSFTMTISPYSLISKYSSFEIDVVDVELLCVVDFGGDDGLLPVVVVTIEAVSDVNKILMTKSQTVEHQLFPSKSTGMKMFAIYCPFESFYLPQEGAVVRLNYY